MIKYIKNPNYRRWFGRKILGRKNWKYKLTKTYCHPNIINIRDTEINTDYIYLDSGWLIIKYGYNWDGPSGPAIDTKNFMRGSLVHDALYQLMREGHLDIKHRKYADKLLVYICKEDGMWWIRRQWVYAAVRLFSGKYAKAVCEV